jgi:predicted nucleic-acid-binding Zn-ribbon protein
MGWTVNFARPSAIPITLLLVAIVVVPVLIVRALGAGNGIELLTGVTAIIVLCLVCAYLSSRTEWEPCRIVQVQVQPAGASQLGQTEIEPHRRLAPMAGLQARRKAQERFAMKRTNKCPKCGSSDIVADAMATTRTMFGPQELLAVTYRKPEAAALFKGELATTLSAWVCADCGYVELYADAPRAIKVPRA